MNSSKFKGFENGQIFVCLGFLFRLGVPILKGQELHFLKLGLFLSYEKCQPPIFNLVLENTNFSQWYILDGMSYFFEKQTTIHAEFI